MLSEGTLVPRSFINPSLPLYLAMPVVWVQQKAAAVGLVSGLAADPLLPARVLGALAGATAVWLLGISGGTHGPLGALMLALAPGFVNLCHFATPEPWLLLGTVGVLFACRRHLEGHLPALVLGLIVGLTGATKYTAAALLAPALLAVAFGPHAPGRPARPTIPAMIGAIVAAVGAWIVATHPLADRLRLPDARLLAPESAAAFVRGIGALLLLGGMAVLGAALAAQRGHEWARRLVAPEVAHMIAGSALGFLAGTPGALVRPLAFLSDLAFNQQTRTEYKGLVGEATSYRAYLSLLVDALTWPLVVLAALGLLVAIARALKRDALAPVSIAAAVAPYLLVASSGHRALRFLAPVFPAAALLAAEGAAVLAPLRPAARRAVMALVLARLAVGSVLVDRLFLVDSRREAAAWLETHVPEGAAIDVITNHAGYAPAPVGRTLRVVPTLSREMAPADRFAEAARDYPGSAAPWLVLTESYYQRFLEHPDQHPERALFFKELLAGAGGFEVVARFRQEGWRRPPVEFVDPEIVILRRR
jgi:hypothetical protein